MRNRGVIQTGAFDMQQIQNLSQQPLHNYSDGAQTSNTLFNVDTTRLSCRPENDSVGELAPHVFIMDTPIHAAVAACINQLCSDAQDMDMKQ